METFKMLEVAFREQIGGRTDFCAALQVQKKYDLY